MSETPTWETVREAIRLIEERWPESGSWDELQAVASRLPEDPALWATSLPENARNSVRDLVGRLAIVPIPRPSGKCEELWRWVGTELNL